MRQPFAPVLPIAAALPDQASESCRLSGSEPSVSAGAVPILTAR